MVKTPTLGLARINVRGVVQGVGFRPFIYQLATRHNLRGWVRNTSEDVKIEIEGDNKDLEGFIQSLEKEAPPVARIEHIDISRGEPAGYESFEIRGSVSEEGKYQLVSPDIATCADCLREIFDPKDRRYLYPFTNCTNCGPRFTIITDIPYDRPNTTMKKFRMCPECRREYENPLDRRFHAQPNACPVCGPGLELVDNTGKKVTGDDPIDKTVELLRAGKTVAVKGLGGFLLACDATNREAVALLRRRKKRPAKPLAIMVASLDEAEEICQVSDTEAELLTSAGSPIVLMKWKEDTPITPEIAPGLKYLGVMLPYTPLHHILLRKVEIPLVMTSGNLSEEPIASDNDEGLRRLAHIAGYFLRHNRDIHARYDDSVMIVENEIPRFTRRARGYAPYPIRLGYASRQILGCGAEEKNTFCLTRDNFAFVSQHIGDMENMETLEHFTNTIELYKQLFRIEPEIIAHDLHPEYLPTKYAKEVAAKNPDIKLVGVQHHHGHIAACLAENGAAGPVIGVSLDGTGYGPDGHIWGGEFMTADLKGYRRKAHPEYLPLPGGALAIKRPYRTAIGYLHTLGIDTDELPFTKDIEIPEINIIKSQVDKGINTPLTSSMGRLFDAVSALTGVRGVIEYEAQAAIDLETYANETESETGSYPFKVDNENGLEIIKLGEMFTEIIKDIKQGRSKSVIAARFHNTVIEMILRLCQSISAKTGLNEVALSGGVFQNRLLLRKAIAALGSAGFEVLSHRQVPCNDGGISLGQVVIAHHSLEVEL
jgi:hydrogenase maturation protein HypF